ncbi:MAG: hypothetical protein MUF81_07590 [Verrucomicrobia bacterium]|jgi:hypothetical protein|nr:hypothetical protein [Verrucomicrobiota bacterium]
MNTNLSIKIRKLIVPGALAVWLFGAVPGAQSNWPTPPPVVTIVATDADASEAGPNTGTFTVTRYGGDQSVPLTVYFTRSGTAHNGVDYQYLPGYVTIAANQPSATVTVTPLQDAISPECNETVVLSIINPYNTYDVGAAPYNTATVTITDEVDSDCDGMADAWELQYFGTLDYLGSDDYDGDGLPNYLDSDPVNADTTPPTFQITSPTEGAVF